MATNPTGLPFSDINISNITGACGVSCMAILFCVELGLWRLFVFISGVSTKCVSIYACVLRGGDLRCAAATSV